jgi:Ca-activated chloride channel family protein
MEFARPLLMLLIPLAVVVLWTRLRKGGDPAALRHPRLALLGEQSTGMRARLAGILPVLSALGLILLLIAAAGPRVAHRSEKVEGEGIDIVLALDISGSMRSLDFHPLDRLESAKEVIRGFIEGRPNDRIGLVVFAARSFTQCPLTLDHPVLQGFLDEIQVGLIDDGTTLEPETAAKLAESLGVRVYTVAIGREGMVPYPVDDPVFGKRTRPRETKIDLVLLKKIADLTGGRMYQATNPEALQEIFRTIDELETARYETTVSTWYKERMGWFALAALILFLLEGILAATWLRRVP